MAAGLPWSGAKRYYRLPGGRHAPIPHPRIGRVHAGQRRGDRAAITGKLAVSLRTARPSYKLTAKVKGLGLAGGQAGCRWHAGDLGHRQPVAGQPDVGRNLHRRRSGFRHARPMAQHFGQLQPGVVADRAAPAPDRPECAHRRRNLHRPRRHARRRPSGDPAHQRQQGIAHERHAGEAQGGVAPGPEGTPLPPVSDRG